MPILDPANADEVRGLIDARLAALEGTSGVQETATVEWRGQLKHIPVISMPVAILSYNPDTHRVRAQRSLDPERDRELTEDPFGTSGQTYLHVLLKGDPTDPTKTDPRFEDLKEDLKEHGQSEPGIITRSGVLINGNTRQAALKELGQEHIRVGVLPSDAGYDDIQSIELSLQLRRDQKRDYSFMNLLLAIEERVAAGRSASDIQRDFRIQAKTLERDRWIFRFVEDAIERSRVEDAQGEEFSLRLVDFETHQGKLEELYRRYMALKAKSPAEAEALLEQRLMAMVFDKSKTDMRLIEPDFIQRYMKGDVLTPPSPPATGEQPEGRVIPGTTIAVPEPDQAVEALRALTTKALRARTIIQTGGDAPSEEVIEAGEVLAELGEELDKALDKAGKQGRIIKKRLEPVDRLSDADDDVELALTAIAESRATGNFNADDLDEVLISMKENFLKLAQLVIRSTDADTEGINWLRGMSSLYETDS